MPGKIVLIEPFYGGSHKELVDLLHHELGEESILFTMPCKKWPWRARCSALHFAQIIPTNHNFQFLFSSSVLNLAELLGMRPDLHSCRKILYFHENQLIYPVREAKDRDFQFGYNQITSCLSADMVLFNSSYNMESFLSSLNTFLKLMPSHRPKGLEDTIRQKSRVYYYPINFTVPSDNSLHVASKNCSLFEELDVDQLGCDSFSNSLPTDQSQNLNQKPLHILWPHRWEHDKNPEGFFSILYKLHSEQLPFTVSVVGESYSTVPPIFDEAKVILAERIVQWGYCEQKSDYIRLLQRADVVISTAVHEFFGVAMLEATYNGCYPLCPNNLAYPEIFPEEHLYNTPNQLHKRLKTFCLRPHLARTSPAKINFDLYSWDHLKKSYLDLFKEELPTA